LPESAHADAERFGVHPALLDATMHALGLSGMDAAPGGDAPEDERPALPFHWEGVRLHATGATALRVRLSGSGEDTVSLAIADATGIPVMSVDGLTLRPVSVGQLSVGGSGGLWEVVWRPVSGAGAAISVGSAVSGATVFDV
ncbi:polyketide synthase dehydratase domain-containing protein, partial [Streptomyces sp. DT171]